MYEGGGATWSQTVVFGGKRPLQPDKESFEQCYRIPGILGAEEPVRKMWQEMNPQTELDMMRWVWRNIYMPHKMALDIPVLFVDAPMKPPVKEGGPPVRPNTEDTIVEWLKINPKPGSVLLSCGAPYGMAIDEAFWMLLEPHGFTVETFGHAAPDLPIENLMREVAGAVNRIRRARKA